MENVQNKGSRGSLRNVWCPGGGGAGHKGGIFIFQRGADIPVPTMDLQLFIKVGGKKLLSNDTNWLLNFHKNLLVFCLETKMIF